MTTLRPSLRRVCDRLSNRNERGAYAILMSFVLVLVIALAAISVDIARQVESKQRLHDTMDAAAHAAVIALSSGTTGVANARAEALRVARANDPAANPQLTAWCVIASTGPAKQPNVSQIPRTCEPDSVRKGPYNATRYPGMTCDEYYCFIPCSERDGKCNTVRLSDNREVDYGFAPVIGHDKGSTGTLVTMACKGTCGTGQPRPIDLVMMADRTYSMYMFQNSHTPLRDMITGIKSSLEVMDPAMHHVAFGAIHKSMGDTLNGRCLTTAVPNPAVPNSRPTNYPIPAVPTRTPGESTSSYNARVDQWEIRQGTWVPVPFSNTYKRPDGTLDANSALVKSIECLRPPATSNNNTAANYYSPADYRTHLASALKGAGRYLLGYDNSNVNTMPTSREGQRDRDGNLIPGAVMKVVIFETDGEPREPLNAGYTGLSTLGDMGTNGESDTQRRTGCRQFKQIAQELKDEDVTVIMIGFGAANSSSTTCGSDGPVRDTLAAAASDHPQSGQASTAEPCNNSASVQRENSDGDFYYCAATGNDLADVFQTALANLSSGVRFVNMPSS